ncbi:hypothetical protein Zmor_011897 [Zophobas morio]|jgi:hypothetical protein|uniref:Uncharacterized protein n=1 Tax=Zophobas morio TaxID=2755281 RepID=A0AA38HHZ4_9CUCU|nr:hypothetical protein Zmor_011897 [Zophobas morio]
MKLDNTFSKVKRGLSFKVRRKSSKNSAALFKEADQIQTSLYSDEKAPQELNPELKENSDIKVNSDPAFIDNNSPEKESKSSSNGRGNVIEYIFTKDEENSEWGTLKKYLETLENLAREEEPKLENINLLLEEVEKSCAVK